MLRIAEVAVEGHDPLGATERAATRSRSAHRSTGGHRQPDRGDRRVYQKSGYDQVSIRANLERLADGSGLVEIQIDPGVQRRLEEVRFTGTRHVDPRFLRRGLDLEEASCSTSLEVDESGSRSPTSRGRTGAGGDVPSGSGGSTVEIDVYEKPADGRAGRRLGLRARLRGADGVRDDNLFGRGVSANLRLRANDEEKVALLYGSLPPLPGPYDDRHT